MEMSDVTQVSSAYTNAEHPERIFFGVYQQNDPGVKSQECINFDCNKYEDLCSRKEQISIKRVSTQGAMGPVYARYMADQLYSEPRDFIIMMDSHLVFRTNWDTEVIKMWKRIKNEYAIITHYPWEADDLESRANCQDDPSCLSWTYHVCGSIFEAMNMPRNANGCHIDNVTKPILTPFFCGGFSFARSHLRDNVQWDPYLKYVFWGEEFGFGSRAWTHGYDFYSPDKDIVGHYYGLGKDDEPKRKSPYNSDSAEKQRTKIAGEKRIQYLWNVLPEEQESQAELAEISKYGMGDKRTLQQFWDFAGMDVQKQSYTVFKKDLWRSGGLQYVPWKE